MNLFDVYPLQDIHIEQGKGVYVWDREGNSYLDMYGGHAVISVGHSHPHYIKRIKDQLDKIGFYSNSVKIELQQQLAELLGRLSGYADYNLFLCNSGAEANENALKVASFLTGRKKILAFDKAFHGRTSAAVAATDNPSIQAPLNQHHDVEAVPLNNREALMTAMDERVAAVIVEGIQGVGGIRTPDPDFLEFTSTLCKEKGACLILDEVQSGYGRSGKFFAHQYANVRPDMITVAKGMGNGFPVGGVLISSELKPWHGMLGTTFGGNHLACAAALAVLEIMEAESLIENAAATGSYLLGELGKIPGLDNARGRGLMLGFDLPEGAGALRTNLLQRHRIFTGAAGSRTIRLLPPLSLSIAEADIFLDALRRELTTQPAKTPL